jgi:hypothetical protein
MKRNLFLTYFLTTLISGCGSNGRVATTTVPTPTPAESPAPPTPTSTVPVISGLSAHFSENPCTRAADGLHGRALVITFDYVDGGNDLIGGHVQLSRVYNTGRSEWHAAPIPSEATLSGSPQRGEADIDDACPLFDNNSSETETVTLVDANGNASNSLSVTVERPAGAP